MNKVFILGAGQSAHTLKWVNSLCVNFDITLYSLHGFSTDLDPRVHQVGYDRLTPFRFLKLYLRLLKDCFFLKPVVVHAHYASSYGFLGVLLFYRNYYVSIWGTDIVKFPEKSALHKKMIQFVLNRANKVFSLSHYLTSVLNGLGLTQNIYLIPFGVDTETFRDLKTPKRHITIGTTKGLSLIYGIDTLLKAFAKIKKQNDDIYLKIASAGPQEAEFRSLAKSLGLNDKDIFMGPLLHSRVPKFLNTLDIFVAPSRQEGFGVAVIEASACEIPVVVSDIGGLPEAVEDFKTGFIVHGDSVTELYERLNQLCEDQKLRHHFGIEGRKFVKEKYDWKVCLLEQERHYENRT